MQPRFLISVLTLLVLACNSTGKENHLIPPEPDYNDLIYWFLNPAEQTSREVDIFYVYPKLGFSVDSVNPVLLADIARQEQYEQMVAAYLIGLQITDGELRPRGKPDHKKRSTFSDKPFADRTGYS